VGYQRKELQILGGSFNLNPPGDKIPKTDYLLAQNWRVDRVGSLVSRFGYPQKFSIAGAGVAHSAFVHGGINGDYYVGAGSAVYWNFNASAIATGLDGARVGFAGMNGWVWFMNRAKQGRHIASLGAGATSQSWNLAAPGGSPTATAASTPTASASVTYTYSAQSYGYIHYLSIAGVVYQFPDIGYSSAQVAQLIAWFANADPNASVSYGAGGSTVVITPIPANTLIQVSGSDSNANTSLATGSVTSLPNGTYTFYVTFESADETLESNGSPVSNPVLLASQSVTLTNIPISSDSRVTKRNLYAIGGTLEQAYLVGTVPDNATTSWTLSFCDLSVTNGGTVMPTTNDPPPACSGMAGPHFSRLFAWATVANPNRLFYTEPDLPQYWPGSGDPAIGNWVDVGAEGEAIIWCTVHSNTLIIYKEHSIWMLVGDPDTGYLQMVNDTIGLSGASAVVGAGAVDYFVGSNGLYRFNLDRFEDITGPVRPLFQAGLVKGALTQPGSILPGAVFPYDLALGYAMGKLYITYQEAVSQFTSRCLLVYHEESGRWFYHRSTSTLSNGFYGFVFDGVEMVGLTRSIASAAIGLNLDDFRGATTVDAGSLDWIGCTYQSHYEDAGLPDNQKNWLEIVIDYEFAGDTATVSVGYDNGTTALASIGTITGTVRQQTSFRLGTDGVKAKNISVMISAPAANRLILHNVYLYYYEEARLALAASTLPTDLGVGKVKQCKELQLDIDPSNGPVDVNIYSDLPDNQLAVRQTPTVAQGTGRAIMKFPFAVTEGYLWRVALRASETFRLYAARLLMRVVGVYVEAYEAAAGFVWDSMEQSFESGITKVPRLYQIALAAMPIKRVREISLEMDTFGSAVNVALWSDLPGNAQAVRFVKSVITANGRRFVRIPLPGGTDAPIEGRMFRLLLSGISKFILYGAALEILAVGVYIEAEEGRGGAVYDSRELDFGTPAVKECRELELDIETVPAYTPPPFAVSKVVAEVLSDIAWVGGVEQPGALANRVTKGIATNGRQKVMLPLTVSAAAEQFIEGRLLRLILSGTDALRLYGARMRVRPFGCFLDASETIQGALWDSTDLDLGTPAVKQIRELELDLWAYGAFTLTAYTDLPDNAMASRVTYQGPATAGRTKVMVPLPQGSVPDAYTLGRLLRATITSAATIKLYGARVHLRAVGCYVEAYEAAGGAVWDSSEQDLGTQAVKQLRELELEISATGAYTVTLYTDLPGNAMAERAVKTQAATSGRTTVQIALPQGGVPDNYLYGRLLRIVVGSENAFQLYGGRVRARALGCYIEAYEAAGGAVWDSSEQDLGTQAVKQLRELELEISATGAYTVTLYTDLPGNAMAERAVKVQAATSGRTTVQIPLPQGGVPDNYLYGRLVRVTISSAAAFALYGARIHFRAIGVYAESYEAARGAVWDSMAQDLGNPNDKYFDQLRFEMDSDGAAVVDVYTDLPGESMRNRLRVALTAGPTSRHWATAPLPAGANAAFSVEGRSIRAVVSSAYGFRLYRAQVRSCRIGRYLAATPPSGLQDGLNTLEFDFQSGRVKVHKKVEIDVAADGELAIALYTTQGGALSEVWTTTISTPNGRKVFRLPLPPGIRGSLLRISMASAAAARVFRLRTWSREVNRADARWDWDEYPLESSDALPAWSDLPMPATAAEFTWADLPVAKTPSEFAWSDLPIPKTPAEFSWADLPVEPTKPEWQWAPCPVNPTEPQWFWAKVLSVEETPETWTWVDVPFEVTGA
jgi:hypothetical protein